MRIMKKDAHEIEVYSGNPYLFTGSESAFVEANAPRWALYHNKSGLVSYRTSIKDGDKFIDHLLREGWCECRVRIHPLLLTD